MIFFSKSKKTADNECAKLRRELGRARRELKERETQAKELNRVTKMLVRRDMEVTRLNDEFVEIERAKSHFATIAAHQLRTPLSIIKWTFRMLLSEDFGFLNDEQKKVVEQGYNVNEGMVKLISDLLDVARIESGKSFYKFEKVHIEDVIAKVMMTLKSRAEEKKVNFEVTRGDGDEFVVLGDKIGLETALENLALNAINYTLHGGRVDIIYNKRDDGYIEVAVKDTGVGVPACQRSRLFTKFFRGNNAVKMEPSGSGLGLFIAKSVISAHGGKIGLESEEGKGSTFWFQVPTKKY